MRVTSNKALIGFILSHQDQDAHTTMQAWRRTVESRAFASFADIKSVFNTVDEVDDSYVFDVGGNKYRIIAIINFNRQKLYIKEVFTHKEYDKWKP